MKRSDSGFSLLELSIAIAVAGIMIVTLLALLFQGLNTSREADEQTHTGIILEDVHTRLRGMELIEGTPQESPLFYNDTGTYIDPVDGSGEEKFYRVELKIVRPVDSQLPKNAPGLMAALVELYWPIDGKTGIPIGRAVPRARDTILVSSLSGPDWKEIDPSYQPKIGF